MPQSPISPVLQQKASTRGRLLFFALLGGALLFIFASLYLDLRESGAELRLGLPLLVLGGALLIALAFEFINGFHDTANAVATVIYTNALPPNVAVIWSGLCNFLGVLLSSGAVAFAIVALLPPDLMLRVSTSAGLAMIFALLLAAIAWNLGTWWLGLPVSSSHTLIGSIVGIGLAHGAMAGYLDFTHGDWQPLLTVGYALLLSPLVGFLGAAALLLALKLGLRGRNQTLFREPQGRTPPPWWIRGLLILTCSGVSFAHGSNDGQKGIGLIMLILVGTVPMAFALDRALSVAETQRLAEFADHGRQALQRTAPHPAPADPRQALLAYQQRQTAEAQPLPALAALLGEIRDELLAYDSLAKLPKERALALRNDLYLSAATIRLLDQEEQLGLAPEAWSSLQALRDGSDAMTHFIPLWVKVAVALALGLGTLVGWRRIVTTVGEGIGKAPMTYAQGASAQLMAMLTIGAADIYGLPVSTTHVLSSGVAGTMVANGSGLQWATIRNMLLAWVLTLPAAIGLAAGLYWLFTRLL
ncbi:inorganic phosphate transporter [Pseudomonas sp. LS44]|nr:inorganic phosphate transporter [Pseudomonas sp. LS44]UVE19824.1 inorganic phosphate transporter [Pseudomonas sp. LS44]